MSEAPTPTESPTRTKLLDAAEDLMLSRGYVATSVDAICSAAGLTKGSFFHYFRNKEELGKVLLERFAGRQAQQFMAECANLEDPLERVYRVIDWAIEGMQSPDMKGCLIGTFAQEISETHPELRQVCDTCFGNFADAMGRDLNAAKARYRPSDDFDAESLGAYFLSVIQGSMLLRRTSGNGEATASNLRHFRSYLAGLYGR